MSQLSDTQVATPFSTDLGWMVVVGSGEVLHRLVFGYRSRAAALQALGNELGQPPAPGNWNPELVERLTAYAAGEVVDFSDVRIDTSRLSAFRRRVVVRCRKVPYGQTVTYGQLAVEAGSPRAARAVGSCMAANCHPLVVPCHRVLPATGRVGAFSAPGGARLKRRLLALEAAGLAMPGAKVSG